MWRCRECGESFTTASQWHSCGRLDLDALLAGGRPEVSRLFDLFVAAAREHGPLTVMPQRSRVALQVRMRFAALMPRKASLRGHLVLAEGRESPRFEKIETYSPRNHVHVFVLESPEQLDTEFRVWIGEAYRAGCQDDLKQRPD